MNIIPKSVGSILILGALAGCAGDDGAPPASSTPPSAGQAPSNAPGGPPAVKIVKESAKAGGGQHGTSKTKHQRGPRRPARRPTTHRSWKARVAKPAGTAAKLTDDDLAGIKELPQAEQDAAIAQVLCPVSNRTTSGSMGKPLKVTAEGRTFYLCCNSCEEKVKTTARPSSPSSTSRKPVSNPTFS